MTTAVDRKHYCSRCLTTFADNADQCPNLACRRKKPTRGWGVIFAAGDLRLVDNRQIVGVLHGSLGIGLYGKLYPEGRDSDGSVEFDGGTRIPVAASVLLLDDFLEFFVEVAPGIDLYPKAQLSDQPVQLFAGFTIQLDM